MTKLRYVLKQRRLTGKQFALMCGMSRSSIYKYLSGNRELSLKTARRLAAFLGVQPADIMGFVGDPAPVKKQ